MTSRSSVRLPAAVSASPTVNAIAPVPVSSSVLRSVMFEIVGAVLVALATCLNAITPPTHVELLPLAVAAPVNGAEKALLHIDA